MGREERRSLALVEHFHLSTFDVNFTRRQLGIRHIGGTSNHFTSDSNHVLISKRPSDGVHFGVRRAEYDLCNPITVPQVNENESTEVTIRVDPATQSD